MADLELVEELAWPDDGLLPAVAQDAGTGMVLTLAWQNREALRRTLETGEVHYFSRSRQALWRKGETSGNTQRVVDVRADCDADAVLMLVEPAGPACHTGAVSCFHQQPRAGEGWVQRDAPAPVAEILDRLAAVIEERVHSSGGRSYVRSLLDDPEHAGAKVMEEAGELVDAADHESADRVAAEAADLLFHLLVLARTRGVDWMRIAAILTDRFGTSGHVEKERRAGDRVGQEQPDPTDH